MAVEETTQEDGAILLGGEPVDSDSGVLVFVRMDEDADYSEPVDVQMVPNGINTSFYEVLKDSKMYLSGTTLDGTMDFTIAVTSPATRELGMNALDIITLEGVGTGTYTGGPDEGKQVPIVYSAGFRRDRVSTYYGITGKYFVLSVDHVTVLENNLDIIPLTDDDFYGCEEPTDIWDRVMISHLSGKLVKLSAVEYLGGGTYAQMLIDVDLSAALPDGDSIADYLESLRQNNTPIPVKGSMDVFGLMTSHISGNIYPSSDSSNGGLFIEYSYTTSPGEGVVLEWSYGLVRGVTASAQKIVDGEVEDAPEKTGDAYMHALSLGERVLLFVGDEVQEYGDYYISGPVQNISVDRSTGAFTMEYVGMMTKTVDGVSSQVMVDYRGTFRVVGESLQLDGATINEIATTEHTYSNR